LKHEGEGDNIQYERLIWQVGNVGWTGN